MMSIRLWIRWNGHKGPLPPKRSLPHEEYYFKDISDNICTYIVALLNFWVHSGFFWYVNSPYVNHKCISLLNINLPQKLKLCISKNGPCLMFYSMLTKKFFEEFSFDNFVHMKHAHVKMRHEATIYKISHCI